MANLFDYLEWRGDLTFSQAPFNPVDNLILSCLGYVVLDGLVSGFDCEEPATVEETARLFVQLPESVKKLRDHKDEKLLEKMPLTTRRRSFILPSIKKHPSSLSPTRLR